MEELKPKLILTKSSKSRFNLARYVFFLLIFSVGFYFGYSYKSLDSDIISKGKDRLTKISDKEFARSDKDKSTKDKHNQPKANKPDSLQQSVKTDNSEIALLPKKETKKHAFVAVKNVGEAKRQNEIVYHGNDNKINNDTDVIPPTLDTSYTLQIAAFETERKSSEVVEELANKGYNVYSISVVNAQGDRWNLVRLGNFQTLQEAKEFSELLLSSEGINSIIKSIDKTKLTSTTTYY